MQTALLLIVSFTGLWAGLRVMQVRSLAMRLQKVRAMHVHKEQQHPV